jgi:hypothetical protein
MALLEKVRENSGIDPAIVEDICLGNVCFFLNRFVDFG